MSEQERTFAMELEIDADPAAVWRALTEAEELMRWFPPLAEVIPGAGGRIRLSWGEDMTGDCQIKIWEPGKRLQMSWWETPSKRDRKLAADFVLEGKDGRTVLRLLHSGFGTDESWDEEYDSVGRGWSFELRSLRHYLERHRGRARQIAFSRIPIAGDPASVWSRLVGQDGLFRSPLIDVLEEAASFELQLPSGQRSAAELIFRLAGKDFAAALEVLGDGILRLGLETFTGQPEIWLSLASWTLAQNQLQETVDSWSDKIRRIASADAAA